ncbi:MAG: SET domain-containing protein [Ferruginibacter sp.]
MRQTILASPLIQVISNHEFSEIRQNIQTKQKALYAIKAFKKDEMISSFTAGEISKDPHYLTVQTGIQQHITLVPEFLQYINHSCQPNVFFNTTTMKLIALADITDNEELCFFYPSTEWEMAQPFYCYCSSKDCLQNIRGAKYLSPDHILKYTLTDFIRQELKLSNL